LFDENFDDTDGHYELSSIEAIRSAALVMYGRFIAHLYGNKTDDEKAKRCTNYLSLQETENIVRGFSVVSDDGVYAIGGDTPEEARKNINELMAALMDRVMSNVLSAGVKSDLLDCSYDDKTNDFTFSVTEKGKNVVEDLRKARYESNRSDIPRDKKV
jgi:hypothetical protein